MDPSKRDTPSEYKQMHCFLLGTFDLPTVGINVAINVQAITYIMDSKVVFDVNFEKKIDKLQPNFKIFLKSLSLLTSELRQSH